MHLLLTAILHASTTSTTTKSSKSSSSSLYPFLVIVVIFGLAYFLFLRPRQQRMRQQQQSKTRDLSVGDEVMSAGGIYGIAVDVDEDSVDVEVADGVVLRFTRRAISLRTPPSGTGGYRGASSLSGPAASADPDDSDWPEASPPEEPPGDGEQPPDSGSAGG